MRKLILSLIAITAFTFANAQVGIETENIGNGAILDFPDDAVKGILLPKIDQTERSQDLEIPGTFIFLDNKVKYFGDGKWEDLIIRGTKEVSAYDRNNTSGEGVVIADGTGSATPPEGALTLESTTRALALPKVADVTELPSPEAGMICYDVKSKSVAVFNGTLWAFWQ